MNGAGGIVVIGQNLFGIGPQGIEFRNIVARSEGPVAGTGHDDAAQIGIGGQFLENIGDACPGGSIERIAFFGAVEGDGRDSALTVEQDGVGHMSFAIFYGCRFFSIPER